MTDIAAIAKGLTKASERILPKLNAETFTTMSGRDARGAYSLWWGRDGSKRLVEIHLTDKPDHTPTGWLWSYRLTPLGLAVRQHLQEQGR